MARFEQDPAATALGEALAALRRAQGLSQAEAAARLNMTSQGWGQYEAGRRPGLFRPDVQQRLTAALDATPDQLAQQRLLMTPVDRARPGSGVESPAAAYDPGGAPGACRTLQLSSDDLYPWAASGVVLEYEPGRWPRRDQGCVIEMAAGEVRVRIYQSADAEALVVRGKDARTERIPRAEVAGLGAVTARLER